MFVSWVDALADFPFAVEIGEGDVEAVDVGGDDGEDEEDAIDEGVHVATCQ